MIHYIGYGFNTDNVTNKSWLDLMKRFDKKGYSNYLEDAKEEYGNADETTLEEHVIEYIEEGFDFACNYLRDIINENEINEGNVKETVVMSYEDYLVSEPYAFPEDRPSVANYIRSRSDFVKMIEKYIPDLEPITFDNIWEGSDWVDPVFFMD